MFLMLLGDDKPLREMDETMASAASDRLEGILQKLRVAGGKVTLDEKGPLYFDFNNDVSEIGTKRTVEINFNKTDFQITQEIKDYRVSGAGHHKHLEKLTRPMIDIKLKRKPENSDQWIGVDVDELF